MGEILPKNSRQFMIYTTILYDPYCLANKVSLNSRYHGKVHLVKTKIFTNDSKLSMYNCLLKPSDHLFIENIEL